MPGESRRDEAHRYVETEQKTGNVVLIVNGPSPMKAVVRNTYAQLRLAQLQREPEVTMFTSDPLDALAAAHERGRRLRAEAAAERLRGASVTRRTLAVSLRSAADRLDPAPFAQMR